MENSDCSNDKPVSRTGSHCLVVSYIASDNVKSKFSAKASSPNILINTQAIKANSSPCSLGSLSPRDGNMAGETLATMAETRLKDEHKTPASVGDAKTLTRELEEKEKDQGYYQIIKLDRSPSPVTKVVMSDGRASPSHDFSIDAWGKFQNMLKNNVLMIKNGSFYSKFGVSSGIELRFKEMLIKEVNDLLVEYNKLYLKTRENNEKIRKRLDKESYREDDFTKAVLDPANDGLGDAGQFVKSLLYLLHENPKIIATIVKNNYDSLAWKVLEETLCNTFYEDVIAEEVYEHDILRLLTELLEVEFDKAKKHTDLFRTEHFTNKILASYLRRNEYRRYAKVMLKTPLLLCVREPTKIVLDPQEIQKRLLKSNKTTRASMLSMPKPTERSRSRFNTEPDLSEILNKSDFMNEMMRRSVTDLRDKKNHVAIPKFRKRETKGDASSPCMSFNDFEESPREDPDGIHFEMVIASPEETAIEKIKNQEIVSILEQNLHTLKKHLTVVIQSIFDHLYSMPIGLRVLCKIIYNLAKVKFPGLAEKDYNEILGNYIFRRWIYPNFISPEHNGILCDLHLPKEETSNNLIEIAKVLQAVFNQSLYANTDIRSELNSYISEIIPSVATFFKELIAVNDDVVQRILTANVKCPRKLKSRSICISLQEIQLLCESIQKNKEELNGISSVAVNLAGKVLFYEKESKIFGDRTDPTTGQKLKPNQAFVVYNELIFPQKLIADNLDQFNKLFDLPKNPRDQEKPVAKAKNVLKQVLLELDSIKDLKRVSLDGKITLNDVLKRCQEERQSYDLKSFASNQKVPVNLSARFLLSILNSLDESYKTNNYYKLYNEMFHDFQHTAEHIDYNISTTKLQLLKAQETLKKKHAKLEEANQKKKRALKRSFVREFIKLIKIPLCITSPSTTKTLIPPEQLDASKSFVKKSTAIPEKINLVLRNEEGCIHERFALARELASKGVLPGRSHSKSWGNERPSGEDGEAWDDIFNEMNYHCETVDEFINIFGSLPEVKEAIRTGEDRYGVGEAITLYYEKINAGAKLGFKKIADDEYGLVLDEIENYITKRLYTKVFPVEDTEQDISFSERCKTLEWVNYDHLEIVPRHRCEDMWQYAAKIINEIDNKTTSVGKLESVVECFKTITRVLLLASTKQSGAGGADDTLPIMIYILLKACPKRIHSNLNFVGLVRDAAKMLAGEGYCFTQLRSAVFTIENLGPQFFKMSDKEFNEQINHKKLKYGFLDMKLL